MDWREETQVWPGFSHHSSACLWAAQFPSCTSVSPSIKWSRQSLVHGHGVQGRIPCLCAWCWPRAPQTLPTPKSDPPEPLAAGESAPPQLHLGWLSWRPGRTGHRKLQEKQGFVLGGFSNGLGCKTWFWIRVKAEIDCKCHVNVNRTSRVLSQERLRSPARKRWLGAQGQGSLPSLSPAAGPLGQGATSLGLLLHLQDAQRCGSSAGGQAPGSQHGGRGGRL